MKKRETSKMKRGYYYLNLSDLNEAAQEEILICARDQLLERREAELREEAELMNMEFGTLLNEKIESHIYSFDYVFNI